ncbi:hypothetical protein [Demequina sp. NBRC 110055]|uniref:hypothetical protein n=1 Tax=Demequina sp. NBRC 110055 TaxID=1570344 RepID=UPI000A02EDF5|nr:hypothetical protein [Demequina sp. NBRC 110055]
MSDMFHAVQRATDSTARRVAQAMATDKRVAATASAIRAGRRRRAVAQSSIAAGLAVGVAGLWSWTPLFVDRAEPARPSGPYEYEATETSPMGDPALLLTGDNEVRCGDQVSLHPGVTVHDARALGRDVLLEAVSQTLHDVMPGDPPATPEPIVSEWPDGPTNDWDPREEVWSARVSGDVNAIRIATVALDGEEVVGYVQDTTVTGIAGPIGGGSNGVRVARIGECEGEDQTWENVEATEKADFQDTRLVAQYWGTFADDERVLLATIVVDPSLPPNTTTAPTAMPDDAGSSVHPE